MPGGTRYDMQVALHNLRCFLSTLNGWSIERSRGSRQTRARKMRWRAIATAVVGDGKACLQEAEHLVSYVQSLPLARAVSSDHAATGYPWYFQQSKPILFRRKLLDRCHLSFAVLAAGKICCQYFDSLTCRSLQRAILSLISCVGQGSNGTKSWCFAQSVGCKTPRSRVFDSKVKTNLAHAWHSAELSQSDSFDDSNQVQFGGSGHGTEDAGHRAHSSCVRIWLKLS